MRDKGGRDDIMSGAEHHDDDPCTGELQGGQGSDWVVPPKYGAAPPPHRRTYRDRPGQTGG